MAPFLAHDHRALDDLILHVHAGVNDEHQAFQRSLQNPGIRSGSVTELIAKSERLASGRLEGSNLVKSRREPLENLEMPRRQVVDERIAKSGRQRCGEIGCVRIDRLAKFQQISQQTLP